MKNKYYLDSCIWRDYLEDRQDKFRPLGEWAFRIIQKIIRDEDVIVFSDIVKKELNKGMSLEEIEKMLLIVPPQLIIRPNATIQEKREAGLIAKIYNIPFNDALHSVIAKNNDAILITRDNHFCNLNQEIKKPEELL